MVVFFIEISERSSPTLTSTMTHDAGTILSSTVAYIFEMGDETKFTSIPVGSLSGVLLGGTFGTFLGSLLAEDLGKTTKST